MLIVLYIDTHVLEQRDGSLFMGMAGSGKKRPGHKKKSVRVFFFGQNDGFCKKKKQQQQQQQQKQWLGRLCAMEIF